MAKGFLTFETAKCKGCGLCVAVCPMKILDLNNEHVNKKGYTPVYCVDTDKCTGCASCAIICPDSIIKVERDN